MMETDTRSVAEILGWQPEHVWHHHDCIYCGAYENSAVELTYPCEVGDRLPTVDDMLAWLAERGYDLVATTRHAGGCDATIESEDESLPEIDLSRPTLHAALEAAVRAVAAEST